MSRGFVYLVRHIACIILVVLLVASVVPRLLVEIAENEAALSLLPSDTCIADNPSCKPSDLRLRPLGWAAGENQLSRADRLLRLLGPLGRSDDQFRLRQAEVAFGLGDYPTASALLVPALEPRVALRSRLTQVGTYESSLMLAYHRRQLGDVAGAAQAFRLAFAAGSGYGSAAIYRDYLEVVAEAYAKRATAEHSPRAATLAGRYFVLAGQPRRGELLLLGIVESAGWQQLSAAEQAKAWTALGLARQTLGDNAAALLAYQAAIGIAPELAEPSLRLLELDTQGADSFDRAAIGATLRERGPQYKLVAPSDPVKSASWFAGDMPLGYDVDDDDLAIGGELTVWIWWRPAPGIPLPQGCCIGVGEFVVQRVLAPNLAPNAGLEWGLADPPLPLGYLPHWGNTGQYAVAPASSAPAMGSTLNLSALSKPAAVRSRPFLIEPGAPYLVGFTSRGIGSLGVRLWCSDDPFKYGFVITREQRSGIPIWRSEGAIVSAQPPSATNSCFLSLATLSGTAEFDGIILLPLDRLRR